MKRLRSDHGPVHWISATPDFGIDRSVAPAWMPADASALRIWSEFVHLICSSAKCGKNCITSHTSRRAVTANAIGPQLAPKL